MTDRHLNGAVPSDAEADRLSAAWNDIATGIPPNVDDVDPELLRLARRLSDRPVAIHARPTFREHLKETIMQSPTVALPTRTLRPTPLAEPFGQSGARPALREIPKLVARSGMRWAAVAATIALLLTTAAGGYLTDVGRPGGGGTGTNVAAPNTGSPEADGTPASARCVIGGDLYTPCGGQLPNIIASLGVYGEFSAEDLAVTRVQMQRWQIAGGQSIEFTTPVTELTGIGMDVVINGAYTATFSAPVTIADDQSRIRGLYTYAPANEVVELVTGDVVIYELGTKIEVSNPFLHSLLQFKSVVIHDGDAFQANLGSPEQVRMTVDGDGALPKPISDYAPSGLQLFLTYSQIWPGSPFPPDTDIGVIVLGPVDPVSGPVGTEGFILWAVQGKG